MQQISKTDNMAIAGDDNYWEVKTVTETYKLNDSQIRVIKNASIAGENGLVWFKTDAIPVSKICSVKLVSKIKSLL